MPFLTNVPLPQCLQHSSATRRLLARDHDRGCTRYLLEVKCLRGGAGGGVRAAARDRLPARRPRLRGPPLPAAPGPRQRLPHPRGRRPAPATPERAAAKFKEHELGFVHLDVKHLPKLRTADGECRKRFLFVAIDRRSRSVHLAVKDDETEASAKAFLE